jgi:hypothetical protein
MCFKSLVVVLYYVQSLYRRAELSCLGRGREFGSEFGARARLGLALIKRGPSIFRGAVLILRPRQLDCTKRISLNRLIVGSQTTTHPVKLHLRVGRIDLVTAH